MISSAASRGALLSLAFLLWTAAASAESPQVIATPEEAGFSRAGLARIDAYLKNEIDGNKIPGAMMLIQHFDDGTDGHRRIITMQDIQLNVLGL